MPYAGGSDAMLAVQEKRSPLQREPKLADITGRRCHVSTTNILH